MKKKNKTIGFTVTNLIPFYCASSTDQTSVVKTIIMISFLIIFSNGQAQVTDEEEFTKMELELAKNKLEQERDAIFTQTLHLTISQASLFHPIYTGYIKEKNELDHTVIKLFVDYLSGYMSSDEKFMDDFIKRSEKFQREELKIRKKYFKKIKKDISIQVASEFYELDDFSCTLLRLNILSSLPFTSSILQN